MPTQTSWKEKYKTGIIDIDAQHKALFNQLDKLSLAVYEGKSHHVLKEILDFLESYINNHFEYEERLMKDSHYGNHYQHISQHRSFQDTFESLKNDFNTRGGGSYLAIRLEKEILKWWKEHVLKADFQYVPKVKEFLKKE